MVACESRGMDGTMLTLDRQRQYQQLLQAHSGIVYKVAGSYSRNVADRDDLVQEICLQLWRSFPSYDPQRRFSTWMYRVALNVAISQLRRRVPDSEPLSEAHLETIGGEDTAHDERLDALQDFIGRLGALDRALMMLYLDERSYTEIAEILGISETNVATKINRIKRKARGQMAGAGPGA